MSHQYTRLQCNTGFNISVQASSRSYCTPRTDTGPYTHVELGFPSEPDDLIKSYAEDSADQTGTVYGWVPAGILKALIIKHRGIKSGSHPVLSMDTEQSALMAEALFKVNDQ
jgi:hypothetical protein